MKQQLEVHREKESCRSCHEGIDPWGIALEHFDAIGLPRTHAAMRIGKKGEAPEGPKLDSTTELPDGTPLAGVDNLKAYLLEERRTHFARSIVKRLSIYAMGRSLELSDREEIDKLVSGFEKNGYRLRGLIVDLVTSEFFPRPFWPTGKPNCVPTMTKPWHLDRRTVLKGAGVSLALPWLEGMTGGLSAADKAASSKLPKRLCCVMFPYGVAVPKDDSPERQWGWFPTGEGKDYELTNVLQPLAGLKQDMTVFQGLSHPRCRSMKRARHGRYLSHREQSRSRHLQKHCFSRPTGCEVSRR